MMHKASHFRAPARRLVPSASWLLLDYLTRLVSRLPLLVVIRGKHRKSRVTCATRHAHRDRAPNGRDRMRLSGRALFNRRLQVLSPALRILRAAPSAAAERKSAPGLLKANMRGSPLPAMNAPRY